MFKIKNVIAALLLITLLGTFLRLYQVMEFPVQLNHDEISQLYDAVSIAQTGKDIYGNKLPFIFPSVNDNKPPYYIYATSLMYLIFGDHEWIIKLPDLIFSILLIPTIFFFVTVFFQNQRLGLVAAFLTAIAPYEIFFGRKGFESGTGVCLMLIGFLMLILFSKLKRASYLYLGILVLAVAMYVYFSHAVIIPILSVSFLSIYFQAFFPQKEVRKFLPKYILSALFAVLLIAPLFWIIIHQPLASQRSKDVFLTQDARLNQELDQITGDNFFAKKITVINYGLNRYLNQFDSEFLFGNGLKLTKESRLDMGPLYFWQLPLLILGIFLLIKKENFSLQRRFILAWILIGLIPSGLTFEAHSPHRVLMVFLMLSCLSAVGLEWMILKLGLIKNLVIRSLLILIGITVVIFNGIYFWHLYSVNYPYERSEEIHYPFKQVAQFAAKEYQNYDLIIFDPFFGEEDPHGGTAPQYYLAYYAHIPPTRFQQTLKRNDQELAFDKFTTRKLDWRLDSSLKNTLVIASNWSLPDVIGQDPRVLKRFYFYDRRIAFYAVGLK